VIRRTDLGLRDEQWPFALLISSVHGMDHLLKRIFPPLIPVWAVAFGFPLWKLGLLLGGMVFGSAVAQTPMGVLSDRYDRQYLLPLGFVLVGFGIGGFVLVPAVALDGETIRLAGVTIGGQFAVMLAVMVVIGVGSSSVHPTGYPLISENVDTAKKGTVLGMWGSAAKFGDGLAPALVGALLLVTSWEWILLVFSLAGVAYAVVLFFGLRRFETLPPRRTTVSDDAGVADAWDGDRRTFVYPLLALFLYFSVQIMAANAVMVFIPEFITSTYGYGFAVGGIKLTPASTASFYLAVLLFVAGFGQLGAGQLVDRYDNRKVVIGYVVVATAILGVLASGSFSRLGLFAVLVALGASLYSINPAHDSLVSEIAPADHEGRTFGYIWTAALIASSVSPVVTGYIGDVAGLRTGFLVLSGVTFLSAVPVALMLSDRVYHRANRGGPIPND